MLNITLALFSSVRNKVRRVMIRQSRIRFLPAISGLVLAAIPALYERLMRVYTGEDFCPKSRNSCRVSYSVLKVTLFFCPLRLFRDMNYLVLIDVLPRGIAPENKCSVESGFIYCRVSNHISLRARPCRTAALSPAAGAGRT